MSGNNSSKKSIKWVNVPYFPVSPKYLVLMAVLFFVGISGTSLSKFESFAISFVAYSVAILLDRAEHLVKFSKSLITGVGGD